MKHSCRATRQKIAGWLALSASERDELRAQAEVCSACRSDLDQALLALKPLAAARDSYLGLRYEGRRPVFSDDRLAKQPGKRALREWAGWSWPPLNPLPVAMATAALSLSMLLYVSSDPGPTRPEPSPIRVPAASANEADSATDNGRASTLGSIDKEAVESPGVVASSDAKPAIERGPLAAAVTPSTAVAPSDAVTPSAGATRSEVATPSGVTMPSQKQPHGFGVRSASSTAPLGVIRRRVQTLEKIALPARPIGLRFTVPKRPASPRRPGASGDR